MRYMLSLLLIFSFGFAQKTTTIKKIDGGEKKIEVKVTVEDDKVLYTVTENGKTEEFEADANDEDVLAKIHEKLEAHGINEKIKVKVCKKDRERDCKKENYDLKKCDNTRKKECKNDAVAWNSKNDCNDKKIKIIKNHKMIDENAGFLGVQIQDLSEQLSTYFKVKDGNGVLVSEVVNDSPAKKAGLKAGDIIIKIDDEAIENAGDLTMTIRSYEPESNVSVSIIRDGKKKKFDATLVKAEQNYFHKLGDLENLGDKHKMFLKMHPEGLEDFEFQGFQFDKEDFKKQIDEMKKELQEMKEDLKKIKEDK